MHCNAPRQALKCSCNQRYGNAVQLVSRGAVVMVGGGGAATLGTTPDFALPDQLGVPVGPFTWLSILLSLFPSPRSAYDPQSCAAALA